MRSWRGVRAAGLLLALTAAGCGQDPGGTGPEVAADPVVTGSASKGPLQGATVSFFLLDAAGNAAGSAGVAPVTTDNAGRFSVTGLPPNVPVLVRTSGGSYVDESDSEPDPGLKRRIAFGAGDKLEAVLPPNATSIAVTPYSMALYKKAFIQAAGANFANVYAAVRQQAASAFGFDPIVTEPADPITGAGGHRGYAILLGAAALAINANATSAGRLPTYSDVIAFVSDFSDGRLDSQSLPEQIRRFRNNNLGVYGGTPPPSVDEAALSQPAPVPNAAPTISAIADQSIPEEGSTGALGFTVGDAEDPATALGLAGASSNTALVPVSNIVFGGSGANRTVTVTPVTDGFGTATITVTVSDTDGGSASTAFLLTVTNVNDPPVITSTIPATATEDVLYTYNATASDPDGPGATWSLGGSHTCGGSINASSGVFTFTPPGPVPPASCVVAVQVSDGVDPPVSQSATVSITAVNDPPTISDFPGGAILEDGTSGFIDYTIGDDETPVTALSFVATSDNQALVPDGTFDYTDDGDGDGASREVTITPQPDEYGSVLVTVTVTDGGGLTAVDTFTLTVDPVSDAPSSQTFGIQTDQDVDYVFGTAEFNFSDAVDAGHGDGSDADAFAAVVVNSLPLNGTLLHNDGVVDNPITVLPYPPIPTSDITLGRFKFRPNPRESGTPYASFTFQVQDTGSTANGGVIASIPYVLQVDVLPVASTASVLPYLRADGTLQAVDPLDPASPFLIETAVPVGGFEFHTLLRADVAAGVASNLRLARLVYILDTGQARTLKVVNLEAGQSHAPVQVSNIADACRINGIAEDLANPGNSIVRIDTAGANRICENGGGDDGSAPAYLVPLSTLDTDPGTAVGTGHCCGIAGIGDSNGALVGVLSPEDDGVGSTFDLVRRDVGALGMAVPVATLEFGGTGQVYGHVVRGLGDQHIYVRARRSTLDTTYKLLRYNVAASNLSELYDYGVSDASVFVGEFDDATHDDLNLYFLTADGLSIRRVGHGAGGPGETAELVAPSTGDTVAHLEPAGAHLAYEIEGPGAGVYSVPKGGGPPITLALDSVATPTFHSLAGTSGGRVFINVITGTTPDFLARSVNADNTGAVPDQTDSQWVGRTFQTTCDFSLGCEDSIAAQTVFLRRGAAGSQADIELVDPVTGSPSGDFLATVPNVSQGAAAFAFGFGDFAQFTFFEATQQADIWLGDTLLAGPNPAPQSLVPISTDPAGDDRWLLFDDEGPDGGGPPVPFNWSLQSVHTDLTQGDADSDRAVLSGSGRYLVFQSRARSLVTPGTPLGVSQIYRRDLLQGTTELVSQDFSQMPGSADSTDPAVSHDGRFIAFRTAATELLGSPPPGPQVVLVDMNQPGNFRLVSDGCGDACDFDDTSGRISISTDGRYVAFIGRPLPGDTAQVWRADTQPGLSNLAAVSLDPDTTERCGTPSAPDECFSATMSGDGRWIAWSTPNDTLPGDANGLSDVLLRDMDSGTLRLVSGPGGNTLPGAASAQPFISADGSLLAFESDAAFVPGDSNGGADIYVYDIGGETLARASTGPGGEQSASGFAVGPAEDGFGAPVLSGDGRYLLFTSDQDDLATPVSPASAQTSPYLKALDRVEADGDYSGDIVRAYLDGAANVLSDPAFGTTLDFGARQLAMHSAATNAVAGDLNGFVDVFAAFHPLHVPDLIRDSDGDGLPDVTEHDLGTNPLLLDTDGDRVSDFDEVNRDFDPSGYQPGVDSDPLLQDTDGDGVADGVEDEAGSNPVAGNPVLHVSFNGNDANCDGSTWDPYPGTGGPGLACALASNTGVMTALPPGGGVDAAGTVFVLYEEFGNYGALPLTGATRQYIAFVGSVGPNRTVPDKPATSSFNGGGSQRAVEVSGAIGITIRSVQITGGSVPAPQIGGGVYLHDADGVADLTLREVLVVGNSAERGGGLAAINDSQTLRVFDSVIENNSATSTVLAAGGGIYVDDAALEMGMHSVVRSNSASGGTGSAQGGGVWISQSFSQIFDSSIENNSAFGGAGSGGGGLYMAPGPSSTNVTVTRTSITGNSATGGASAAAQGGGGINVAAGVTFVTLERNVVADNATDNGPGGGINLMNGNGVVRHLLLLANQSNRPGAGLHAHVDPGAGSLAIFNNLVVGNVSTDGDADGAGMEIEHNTVATLTIESNTVAYNQAVANPSTGQGAGLSVDPATSPGYTFRNNIVWYNDNATVNDPLSPEPGDNLLAQAPLTAAGNNANEAFGGNAAAMPAVPSFTEGFYLKPGLSTSIDAGDGDASGAGLADPFTTDPTGLGDGTAPNLAQIDIGFHHEKPSPGAFDGVQPAIGFTCVDFGGPRNVPFAPLFGGALGRPGRLVVVEFSGAGLANGLQSLSTLDPRAGGSRIARDLGDGNYLITVDTTGSPGTGTFSVYADDDPTPQVFTVDFGTGCS